MGSKGWFSNAVTVLSIEKQGHTDKDQTVEGIGLSCSCLWMWSIAKSWSIWKPVKCGATADYWKFRGPNTSKKIKGCERTGKIKLQKIHIMAMWWKCRSGLRLGYGVPLYTHLQHFNSHFPDNPRVPRLAGYPLNSHSSLIVVLSMLWGRPKLFIPRGYFGLYPTHLHWQQ